MLIFTFRKVNSIEETEQPEWYAVAKTYLCVVNCDVTVGNIFYLLEGLVLGTYLECIVLIHEKISFFRHTDFGNVRELVHKECFSQTGFIDHRLQGIHKVGVVKINLFRSG